MSRATGQLERSLAALTIGVQSSIKQRQKALSESSGEFDQQVQIPLHGQAGGDWAHVDKQVNFRLPFLNAKSQRATPFDVPHFTSGVVFDQPPPCPLLVTADVVAWTTSPRGWIVGAMIRLSCVAVPSVDLGVSNTVAFSATVHLNFQGYASFPESIQETIQ